MHSLKAFHFLFSSFIYTKQKRSFKKISNQVTHYSIITLKSNEYGNN